MHFIRTIAIVLAAAQIGCGRVEPGAPDGALDLPDAGPPALDASGADAAAPLGPWSTPARVAVLSTIDHVDTYPTVRGDGLEMYFVSDRDGVLDLYVSRRWARSEAWGPPEKVLELDQPGSVESGPDLSDDGKTIWFARGGYANGFELFTASRDSTADAWGAATRVTELNTALDDMSPHVTADGTTMYFASGDSLGNLEIYRATRSSPMDAWGSAQLVNRLVSAANEDSPSTTGDGLEIYIDSNRDGARAIYRSTKPPEGGPWSIPEAVPELAGAYRADVTADGRYIVLAAPGGTGLNDVFEAWR